MTTISRHRQQSTSSAGTARGEQLRRHRSLTELGGAVVDHGSARHYGALRSRPGPDPFIGQAIDRYSPPGAPIAEVGPHTGNNLLELKGRNRYAVELDPEAVQALRYKAKAQGQQLSVMQWDTAAAEQSALPPQWEGLRGRLGAIYGVQVFAHMNDPAFVRTVQRLSQYLRPEGVLVFSNFEKGPQLWHRIPLEHRMQGGAVAHSFTIVQRAAHGMNLVERTRFRPDDPSLWWWEGVAPDLDTNSFWYVLQKPTPLTPGATP